MEVRIKGPKGCAASLSWRGARFEADKHGVFTVPEQAADELAAHGFERVADDKDSRK